MPKTIRSNYFKDGKTIIDFVLVIHSKELWIPESYAYVKFFIGYLQERGLKFEINKATEAKGNLFVKVNFPSRVLRHFAKVYNINIRNAGHNLLAIDKKDFDLFDTPLTRRNQDVFKRTSRRVTSMERILIMNEVLNDAFYGRKEDMRGLEKLISIGIIKTAYPLHDGVCDYNESRPDTELNDRQLLLKYWANFSLFYKKQPLNLIEKYYGTEIAFYFAWVGFYNKMLIPASIVGVFCFVFSIITLKTTGRADIEDSCNTKILMCPACVSYESCFLKPLNNTCGTAKVHYMFDNITTVIFAVFMSLWATVFLRLWRRAENVLKIRWNVEVVESDTKIRMDYKAKATTWKPSPISGDLEPFIPLSQRILYRVVTYGICYLMFVLVCVAVSGVIIYRITMGTLIKMKYREKNHEQPFFLKHVYLIVMVTGAIIQVIFIKVFGKFYGPLSVWLTRIENPRTQREFDEAVIHKRYYLGFANNYVPLFYIAFMKGRLYTPSNRDAQVLGIEEDVCLPTGCILALCIQLTFLMLFKSLVGNIWTLVVPIITKAVVKYYKSLMKSKKRKEHIVHQLEVEYGLSPSEHYLLTSEYMEMIIQYGFVTLFVAAFPLAPLCALINNALELRLDAYKFVARHRRPVPRRQSGIGAWNELLHVITYFSTATNAFVLAFTSDFVSREIYTYQHGGSLRGFLNSTFSVFDLKEFKDFEETDTHLYAYTDALIRQNITTCHYKALRYPPDHELAYELRPEYFFDVGMRLLCVILFEQIIVFFRAVVTHILPDMPVDIQAKINNELYKTQTLKVKMLSENINKKSDRQSMQITIRKNIEEPT